MNVSRHGELRVRERFGTPKRSVCRMAERALYHGATREDFAGSMRRYLDRVFHAHGSANNLRIYNQHLFIFAHETLVTAWPLPQHLRNAATIACREHAR